MAEQDIRGNLERVREAIAQAWARAGRSPADVLLIAVSKTVEVERIERAIAAGVPALGENRVQEAREKIETLGRPVPWHLIGHLQTNKAKDAVRLFDWLHSVDRLELAAELDRRARALGRAVDVLLEGNVGEEPQKSGVRPDEVKPLLDALAGLSGIRIRGLMASPPAGLVHAQTICATDVRADRLEQIAQQYGIRTATSNSALVAESDVVILAVKPQIMGAVVREIAGAVDARKLLISIAAGVATRTVRT